MIDCLNKNCGREVAGDCENCGAPLCAVCLSSSSCEICDFWEEFDQKPPACEKCGGEVSSWADLEFCLCGDCSKCEKCRNDHECLLTENSHQLELFADPNLPF